MAGFVYLMVFFAYVMQVICIMYHCLIGFVVVMTTQTCCYNLLVLDNLQARYQS